jgi:hydroxyethylthiazole kinase
MLATGARPIMAHAPEEVEEITRAARGLVLNLGTPSRERVETMLLAGKTANAAGIPIVFDPVGIGASAFRKECAARIFAELQVALVRGNAGEIGALAGIAGTQSGVDSARTDFNHAAVARSLARKHHAAIVVTGAADSVSDGARVAVVENGHPLLRQITGAGDMLDAAIGASAAVEGDALLAATSALLWFGIAAERAAVMASGAASFRVALLDALGGLDAETIRKNAKVRWLDG